MNLYSPEADLNAMNLIQEVDKEKEQQKYKESMKYFDFMTIFAHGVGVLMMVLTGYVFGTVQGGLQWRTNVTIGQTMPTQVSVGHLNFHGFLMTSAFIFFQGEALLAYRIHRHEIKVLSKVIHGSFHLVALCCAVVAFTAIQEFKKTIKLEHFYSFHSWVGIIIIVLYILQFIVGFVNFGFPKTALKVRKTIMPYHVGLGKILLGASTGQVLMGHVMYYDLHVGPYEDAKFRSTCRHTLSCPDHIDILQNFTVVGVILYSTLVLILISKADWIRKPTPDEIKQE